MRCQSILASFGLLLCVTSAFGQEGKTAEASGLDKDLLKKSVLVTEVAGTDVAKITILNQDQKTSRDMFDAITSFYMSRWVRSEKIERNKLFGRGTMKSRGMGNSRDNTCPVAHSPQYLAYVYEDSVSRRRNHRCR